MIELTKEILEKLWYGEWDKELVNQILDDYEKARKYENHKKVMESLGLDDKMDLEIQKAFANEFKDHLQNQKLRERIEKRIEEWKTNEEPELCQCDDCLEIRPHDVELFEELLENIK